MKAKEKMRAIVIGGSAGSIPVINTLLSAVPADYHLPIIICSHRMKNSAEGMTEVLGRNCCFATVEPNDKEQISPGKIYVAPSNYHMLIEKDFTFSLSSDILFNYSRPSIDITFETAAQVYGSGLTGVIVTGANRDGARGMLRIKQHGGLTIAQDPSECVAPYMPLAAMELHCVDHVMTVNQIISFLFQKGLKYPAR